MTKKILCAYCHSEMGKNIDNCSRPYVCVNKECIYIGYYYTEARCLIRFSSQEKMWKKYFKKAAENMINGVCCQFCGEFLDGKEPGYPRSCDGCKND